MKKNSSGCKSPKVRMKATRATNVTVGMDLGDKTSRYCMLDKNGEVSRESSVATTKKAMTQVFATMKPCRVAIEVGTHSPWVSRLLKSCGHEVIVANARQVQLISKSSRKNDRMDAQTLARLARVDPRLLRPVQHRSEQAQGLSSIDETSGSRRYTEAGHRSSCEAFSCCLLHALSLLMHNL